MYSKALSQLRLNPQKDRINLKEKHHTRAIVIPAICILNPVLGKWL